MIPLNEPNPHMSHTKIHTNRSPVSRLIAAITLWFQTSSLTSRLFVGIAILFLADALFHSISSWRDTEILGQQKKRGCPNYFEYSKSIHPPLSEGDQQLSYMRPEPDCRTFRSKAVENVIKDMKERLADPDMARLFENAFPNTLDTTIWWYTPHDKRTGYPRTFIATGDIAAEWLRDSANQLSVYTPLISSDEHLKSLIKGAVIQQAMYMRNDAYCNAFQPPAEAKIKKVPSSKDTVSPKPDWNQIFECKWEVDSLASFLDLTNNYIKYSGDITILSDPIWSTAFTNLVYILKTQSIPTKDEHGRALVAQYTFQRDTMSGTETLCLGGRGNPIKGGTGLIRSAFRPSDDACIFQFFIPGNAYMAVELERIAHYFEIAHLNGPSTTARSIAEGIRKGINDYGVVEHKKYGKVFAYEVDGFGGTNIMDDANLPSLLSLPDLGFLSVEDPIYQNTRKMVLESDGNPYFVNGRYYGGIGGPHVGLSYGWPMSMVVQIRTSQDDAEILKLLEKVVSTTRGLGLMHEGIEINSPTHKYSRQWFSWGNSEFAKAIIGLAERKPHLIFKDEYSQIPYRVQDQPWYKGI